MSDALLDNHLEFGLWPKAGHVHLTKLEATRDLKGMLPTAYWLRGTLAAPTTVGEPLSVIRYERAGGEGEPENVECLGIFTTSPIARVNRLDGSTAHIHTRNSVWHLEFLPAIPMTDPSLFR